MVMLSNEMVIKVYFNQSKLLLVAVIDILNIVSWTR
jgi:hypothetical protein